MCNVHVHVHSFPVLSLGLLQAAKNFQMKESEQKSVSEARGYIPMVTPQQVAMSARNLSPAIASTSLTSSSGGVRGGEVGKASEGTQAKEKKDGKEAKPEETGEEKLFTTLYIVIIVMIFLFVS